MATITNEAIDKILEKYKRENSNVNDKTLKMLEEDNRYNMIAKTLDTENYIVTPKDIDEIINIIASIIAHSINDVI